MKTKKRLVPVTNIEYINKHHQQDFPVDICCVRRIAPELQNVRPACKSIPRAKAFQNRASYSQIAETCKKCLDMPAKVGGKYIMRLEEIDDG